MSSLLDDFREDVIAAMSDDFADNFTYRRAGVDYIAQGWASDLDLTKVSPANIIAGDMQISLLRKTFMTFAPGYQPADIIPKAGDSIVVRGKACAVISASSDAAGVTWILVVRG